MDKLLDLQVASQRGAWSLAQLLAAGWAERTVMRRVGRDIERPFRGAYILLPCAQPADARRAGAAISLGWPAEVSHASALRWWQVVGAPEERAIHLATRHGRTPRPQPGLQVHHERYHHPALASPAAPVVAPARALVQVAPRVSEARLREMTGDLLRRRLVDLAALDTVVRDAGPRSGGGRVLDHAASLLPVLDSGFEQDFFDWVATTALPPPQAQVLVEDGTGWFCHVDAAWPELKIGVMLDGWRWHGDHASFVGDRAIDRRLAALGWLIVRITFRDLVRGRAALERELLAIIARRQPAA